MFGPLFDVDPFHHVPIPPAFLHANCIVPTPSGIPLPTHVPRSQRHTLHVPPHHHHHQRQHRLPHRNSFYLDPSPTSSDHDLTDDMYHQSESESSLGHAPTKYMHVRHKEGNNTTDSNSNSHNNNNLISPFHRTTFKLPHQTFANLPATHTSSSVFILPSTLTPLHVRISTPSSTHTLRATVAGDMRFRDVVKQLVQPGQYAEVRACVRLHGEWMEPGSGYRINELMEQGGRHAMNERGEIELKIEVGGRGGGRSGYVGGTRGFRAWERETGRAWEIRE
jgi:hypothetical protein